MPAPGPHWQARGCASARCQPEPEPVSLRVDSRQPPDLAWEAHEEPSMESDNRSNVGNQALSHCKKRAWFDA
jgi:hypothetical protein